MVGPLGVEPRFAASEAAVLSIELWTHTPSIVKCRRGHQGLMSGLVNGIDHYSSQEGSLGNLSHVSR